MYAPGRFAATRTAESAALRQCVCHLSDMSREAPISGDQELGPGGVRQLDEDAVAVIRGAVA